MANVLCITGMHRSGTSLTASWINKCGLQIDNGKLIGPGVGNAQGHFEDKEFVDLHSKFILRIWPTSKNWIVYNSSVIKENIRKEFLAEARGLVESRMEKYSFWGWKDPRTILFLALWKELIPELQCLFVWRPAADVVSSLVRRSQIARHAVFKINGFKSFLLWKHYNLQMLNYYRDHVKDCALISIEDIVLNNRASFDVIRDRFSLDLTYYQISDLVREDLMVRSNAHFYFDVLHKLLHVQEVKEELIMYSERIGR